MRLSDALKIADLCFPEQIVSSISQPAADICSCIVMQSYQPGVMNASHHSAGGHRLTEGTGSTVQVKVCPFDEVTSGGSSWR